MRTRGPVAAPAALVWLVAISSLGACSSDTAIVLSIHAVDSQAQSATRLEVFLGAGKVASPPSDDAFPAEWWRRTAVEIDPTTLTFSPTFGDRTYDLLLTPSSGLALDAELVFAVVARGSDGVAGEAIVGFAHADAFVRFGAGEVRRIDVPLPAYDPDAKTSGVTASGCAWWTDPDRDGPATSDVRDRAIVPIGDLDCDGYRGDVAAGCQLAGDCDDGRPDINPGQVQGCIAEDTDCCATSLADVTDADGDGWKVCDGDCADVGSETDMFGRVVLAKDIHPDQQDDTCNGVDEICARANGGGCDGAVVDPDGDGYVTCRGSSNQVGSVRQPSCQRFPVPDCLEAGAAGGIAAAEIHATAEDTACDGVDQNCDGHCDNGGPLDGDQDGFARCGNTGNVIDAASGLPVCEARIADCDDTDTWQRPGLVEACDGIDVSCDGMLSTNRRPCLPVVTGATACTMGSQQCTEVADGQPSFDTCAPNAGGPMLPPGFCGPCAVATDPLLCDDGRFRTCGVHTTPPTGSTACTVPFQQVVVSSCPTASCTWTLEGGLATSGWQVTLVDAANLSSPVTPTATFTGLGVTLRALVTGPAAQGFILKRVTSTNLVSFDVVMLEHDDAACGPVVCVAGGG